LAKKSCGCNGAGSVRECAGTVNNMPAKFGWREPRVASCVCLSVGGAVCGGDGELLQNPGARSHLVGGPSPE
jgi:hypothetical protein